MAPEEGIGAPLPPNCGGFGNVWHPPLRLA